MTANQAVCATPYWWEGRADPALPVTEPHRKVDLAVIGAGFTGLSAAITAAEAGAEVLCLDAGQPGQGASTRNGGMIGAPHRPEFMADLSRYGPELARRLIAEGQEAYAYTSALHHAAGCFQHTGRVQLAYTARQFRDMADGAAAMRALGASGIEVLGREEMGAHVASDLYFGGLYYPDHGAIQPRDAFDAMLGRARGAGVRICPSTPVTGLRPRDGGFELATPRGPVRAGRLVWATNGYTGPEMRFLARRIFRVPSFIIATEELPPGTIDRLAPGRRMMVEARARHSYFRPSPDGKRILFGGRAALVPIPAEQAARRLQQTMAEIWPEAGAWRITHCWSGFVGFTFARVPHVGLHEGVHFAYGYCGNGVALSPWLGRKAALRALGDPQGRTAFAETPLESRPYHFGGRPWFMQIASPWWRLVVDRRESAQARRDRACRISA